MKNYFDILEINPGSSINEIKQAYRKLAKKYHPDLNKSPDAARIFIEINEAYEMLLYSYSAKSGVKIENDSEKQHEEFIKKVKEEAQRRAQMKYEKFQREHEAFRESGLYDVGLILKYLGIVFIPVIATLLIITPIYFIIIYNETYLIIPLIFFLIIGGVLWVDFIQRRKSYFSPGKFYYNWKKIKSILFYNNQTEKNVCSYCKGYIANAKPFRITIIHVKSIHLQNKGPMQHIVGYTRTEEKIAIPRSRKAFYVHLFVSLSKILTILGSLLFFPVQSLIWRFIAGLFSGWILSSTILLFTHTRSKAGYFFSLFFLIKITFWLLFIITISRFSFTPFSITTSQYTPVFISIMFLLDSVLEQLLKMQKHNLFIPYIKPYKTLNCFSNKNFLYLEIPFWTVLYPLIRWIL